MFYGTSRLAAGPISWALIGPGASKLLRDVHVDRRAKALDKQQTQRRQKIEAKERLASLQQLGKVLPTM